MWEIRPWVIPKCFICSVSTNPSYFSLLAVTRVITSSCSHGYVTHRWQCIYLGTLFPRCTSAFLQSTLTWEPPLRATHDKTRSTMAKCRLICRAYLLEQNTKCAWIHIRPTTFHPLKCSFFQVSFTGRLSEHEHVAFHPNRYSSCWLKEGFVTSPQGRILMRSCSISTSQSFWSENL